MAGKNASKPRKNKGKSIDINTDQERIIEIKQAIEKALDFLQKSQENDGSFLSTTSTDPDTFSHGVKMYTTFATSLILPCLSGYLERSIAAKTISNKGVDFLLREKNTDWSWNYWQRESSVYTNTSHSISHSTSHSTFHPTSHSTSHSTSYSTSYPNDLDDTFCALSAIRLANPEMIDGKVLAKIVKLLVRNEKIEGGPYYTWLTQRKAGYLTMDSSTDLQKNIWYDIDPVVNANIAYFLSLENIYLPNLNRYIEEIIEKKDYRSRYYFSPSSIIYFITRGYCGKNRQQLIEFLLESTGKRSSENHPEKSDNPLEYHKSKYINSISAAMIISALIRLTTKKYLDDEQSHKQKRPKQSSRQEKLKQSKQINHFIRETISLLLSQQSANGSWPADPVYIEKIEKQKIYYSGATTITSAFCIEALTLYIDLCNANDDDKEKTFAYIPILTPQSGTKTDMPVQQSIRNEIKANILNYFKKDFLLGKEVGKLLARVTDNDTQQQIMLLPYFTYHAIANLETSNIPNTFSKPEKHAIHVALGTANTFGWMAYRVFDDIMDDRKKVKLLPIANACLRECLQIYLSCIDSISPQKSSETSHELREFLFSIFNRMDKANALEQYTCRFSNVNGRFSLADLPLQKTDVLLSALLSSANAEKSLGHLLGAVVPLFLLGYSPKSDPIQIIADFFIHTIAGRQLNDDAHDWLDDLNSGLLTNVNSLVLEKWRQRYEENSNKITMIDLKINKHELQEIFWNSTIPTITEIGLGHIAQARKALNKLTRSGVFQQVDYFESILAPIERATRKALEDSTRMFVFLENY
jgi:hypothetical protein